MTTTASCVFTNSLTVHAFHQSQVFLFKISRVHGWRFLVLQGLTSSPRGTRHLSVSYPPLLPLAGFSQLFSKPPHSTKTKQQIAVTAVWGFFSPEGSPQLLHPFSSALIPQHYAQTPSVSPFPPLPSLPGSWVVLALQFEEVQNLTENC